MLENKQIKHLKEELIRSGNNFLGILNDIKRQPENAAEELGVSINQINSIIKGEEPISFELIEKAVKIWPVSERDFFVTKDDSPNGVFIMKNEESEKSSRIMNRAGSPYYEYRDTAMTKTAPFRPEWILELCEVEDNNPENSKIQWNNGHFLHQFTYFIGDVNFYYKGQNGEKKVAIMNTGDSMYITPFVPHTFATRKNSKGKGLILALTYGGKLTGDTQQELSTLSNLGSKFALDFTTKEKMIGSTIEYFRKITSLTIEELSDRISISLEKIEKLESGDESANNKELQNIANALGVNLRDILPNDEIEEKVILKYNHKRKKWFFPFGTNLYEFVELAQSKTLPFSKSFEVIINNEKTDDLNLEIGLHQYIYNIGETSINLNWKSDGSTFHESVNPGDSACIKPFVKHNFTGEGKLLVLRIGGKISGDPQRELSIVGKENTQRAINETMQWFDSKGKN
tara:strand:- start:1873 stop:3246 length:1374 start_codon:yes stop_codon:yes gene_type:complete